jgi:hypothetical protein
VLNDIWVIAMIESKFHLTHKQREVPFEAAVLHLQSSFGKSPEVLDPVNVCRSGAEAVTMTDPHMTKAAMAFSPHSSTAPLLTWVFEYSSHRLEVPSLRKTGSRIITAADPIQALGQASRIRQLVFA